MGTVTRRLRQDPRRCVRVVRNGYVIEAGEEGEGDSWIPVRFLTRRAMIPGPRDERSGFILVSSIVG